MLEKILNSIFIETYETTYSGFLDSLVFKFHCININILSIAASSPGPYTFQCFCKACLTFVRDSSVSGEGLNFCAKIEKVFAISQRLTVSSTLRINECSQPYLVLICWKKPTRRIPGTSPILPARDFTHHCAECPIVCPSPRFGCTGELKGCQRR